MTGLLSILVTVGCVVCWVIVLTKLFPTEGALKGVLGIICGLYAFIWGWQNKDRFSLGPVMMAWTALILVNIALSVVART